MEIDVYTDFDQEIENIWSEFEKHAHMTPFQSYAWLSHWQETVGGPLLSVTPQIVHIYDNEKTLSILPMGIRNKMGIQILEWLGGSNIDYMGPLVDHDFERINGTEDLWPKAQSRLLKHDVVHFQKQPNWVVKLIENIGFPNSKKAHLNAHRSELPADWDTYFYGLKKSLRSDSRRQRRRLEEMGTVEFICANNSLEKNYIIKSMITQKRRRYRDTGVKDTLAIEENRKFYEGLAYLSSVKLDIHCSSLTVDNVKIATHVGFVDEYTFYYLMPAYEGYEWEKFSPGRMLLIELLRWSIEKRLNFFDFTIGDDNYKKSWSDQVIPIYESVEPLTFFGRVYCLFLSGKYFLKNNAIIGPKIKLIKTWFYKA